MPLPESFSEWEHLQDTIRLWHNKAVAKWFKNQPENAYFNPQTKFTPCLRDERWRYRDNDHDASLVV